MCVLGEVIVVPKLQANEDASLSPRVVVVGLGRPSKAPRTNPCRFNILSGLMNPRGLLLHVWLGDDLGHDGSGVLMLKILSCSDVRVLASSLLARATIRDGELVGPNVVGAGSEHDVARSAWCGMVCI